MAHLSTQAGHGLVHVRRQRDRILTARGRGTRLTQARRLPAWTPPARPGHRRGVERIAHLGRRRITLGHGNAAAATEMMATKTGRRAR